MATVSNDVVVKVVGVTGRQLDRLTAVYERYLSLLEAGRGCEVHTFVQFFGVGGDGSGGVRVCGDGSADSVDVGVVADVEHVDMVGQVGSGTLPVPSCGGDVGDVFGGGSRESGESVVGGSAGVNGKGKHYEKNKKKKERVKALKAEARAREAVGGEKYARMQRPWRGGYCETVVSGKSQPRETVSTSSSASSRTLVEAKLAAEESLARRRVVENELAIAKTKAQIASYADVEKSKAIAELKIARIAQWNNEARMKSQKSWADYKRSLENSPVPSFKASDLPSAASAGEYWWKQQCLKSKEMEEQIKHLEALLKASMPYVTPEGLEKMREVPDPEPVIDPEFEALKRAHRELAVAEGLDGYDSGDDIGYDLFMPPRNL